MNPLDILRNILYPAAWLYRFFSLINQYLTFRTVFPDSKVVSIGNLSTGGTGKTPAVLYVAPILKKQGFKVCILSRGYRSKFEKKGAMLSDGKKIFFDAQSAGDEPYLLARRLLEYQIPVYIGRNRLKNGLDAITKKIADLFILDDGFQHFKLNRNIDIVLVDITREKYNKLLPVGNLREPVSALKRANIIFFTRTENNSPEQLHNRKELIHRTFPHISVFFTTHRVKQILPVLPGGTPQPISVIHNKKVVCFSGIAQPFTFEKKIRDAGALIIKSFKFPDHYKYKISDIKKILKYTVKFSEIHYILTTEKDAVKLLSWKDYLKKYHNLYFLHLDLVMTEDETVFTGKMQYYLGS
jgi:tetraacyldisaccharide 4'-kinase